ncbi:MAG TPA: NAD-dependent epimerase/dehydratase family protein [Tepidisphaeraceae bacterium]|nr:NAD-dependent epimerase/dehydratase family protein [Tepidisphaeraceae bacterium]
MERNDRVRVGIVGAGYVSVYHARALRSLPFVDIVGIVDLDKARAQAVAEQFAIPHIFASLEALADTLPNVIHILTPPASHASLALQALDMGCHVFVEKPMAETVADCDRMIASAREKGLVLSVNHSARLDPIVLQALEMARNGACGEILSADFLRSSDYMPYSGGPSIPPQFRNGSYPFQDLGVHGLYLLEAFLGPIEHTDIRYYASGMGDPNLVFNEWHGLVECSRGVGHMYISWNVRPMQNELIVHGTRGVMHVDCYLQTISLRKTYPAPKPVQRILGAGINSLSMLWKVTANTVRFATGRLKPSPGIHVSVVKFHEALHRGENPPVPAEEGRRIISVVEDVSRRADADKLEYLAESQPRQQPRILVTGANGFVGRALARRLRESGEPVRLMVRRPSGKPAEDNVQLIYGDLGDPFAVDRAVQGIEVVYHVGAAMKGGPMEFQAGTVWGTRNVVDACARHGVRRLVHMSSMSVLDHAGHEPATPVLETSPYEPYPQQRGLYTQTKLEAEKLVLEAARDGRINAVVLRPGQIYGPGTEHFPPSGTISIAGRWLVVGSGEHYVPFVYVENVVDALLLAADPGLPNGSIFQLVDPDGIRQKDYVAVARASGRPVRASYVPAWFLTMASWGVEILGKMMKRSVPLTPYRIRSIRPLWPCDCTAAHTQLGWKPRVGLREGLERTFSSNV